MKELTEEQKFWIENVLVSARLYDVQKIIKDHQEK